MISALIGFCIGAVIGTMMIVVISLATVKEERKVSKTDIKALAKALRCVASVKKEVTSCEGCPYLLREEIDIEGLPDGPWGIKEENGKHYYESCDCDRMALDAAKVLEEL